MIYAVLTHTRIRSVVLYYMGITDLIENLMKNMKPSSEKQALKYTKCLPKMSVGSFTPDAHRRTSYITRALTLWLILVAWSAHPTVISEIS